MSCTSGSYATFIVIVFCLLCHSFECIAIPLANKMLGLVFRQLPYPSVCLNVQLLVRTDTLHSCSIRPDDVH